MALYTRHWVGEDARTHSHTYELRRDGRLVASGLFYAELMRRVLLWSVPGDTYRESNAGMTDVADSPTQTVEAFWQTHADQWFHQGRDRRLVNQWLREKRSGLSGADKLLQLERGR